MSFYTVFIIAVVVLAVAGYAFKLNGEMAGLGKAARRGSFRAPHGRLVRTKRLDTFEDSAFCAKLARVGGGACAITLLIFIVCFSGLLHFEGLVATSLDILVVGIFACAFTQADAGIWRALGYAFVGYLALGGVSCAIAFGADQGTAVCNGATMIGGTIGCSLCVSAMPLVRTYAREFEDGYVNAIQVASNSRAARAYDKLADAAWEPPKDRIQYAGEGENPRKSMENRSKSKER